MATSARWPSSLQRMVGGVVTDSLMSGTAAVPMVRKVSKLNVPANKSASGSLGKDCGLVPRPQT